MTKPKVNPTGSGVKREYRSTVRDEQALATRRRIRSAAEELFVRDGYGATTMAAVAAAAGVSRPTVFNTFGSKPELLKEVADVRLVGDDEPFDVLARPLGRAMLEATDPEEVLVLHARLAADLLGRIAPVLAVITEAAATDDDAAALLAEQEEGRFFGMGATVDRLVELGALRRGLARDGARRPRCGCSAGSSRSASRSGVGGRRMPTPTGTCAAPEPCCSTRSDRRPTLGVQEPSATPRSWPRLMLRTPLRRLSAAMTQAISADDDAHRDAAAGQGAGGLAVGDEDQRAASPGRSPAGPRPCS